jgi:hypothetical protein
MRHSFALTVALAGTLLAGSLTPAGAQDAGRTQDRDQSVQGGGTLPPGWSARPDGDGDLKNVKFVVMEPGYHLTLGPATILYRERDRVNGPFHTQAKFHQMKKLQHAEGYGLIFGGQALDGKGQKYTYFLVRDDGTYLIKRRNGEKTSEVTKGWTPHPAIKKGDAQGRATNLLEIDAKEDATKVGFKVNAQTVYTADAKNMELNGIIGLRANHNLDVHIEGFDVHK